jgi:flagellar basal-body rod modification protein FlgD
MATTYLGRKVSVTNGQASLSGGAANWTYNLSTAAAATTLTVTNASNQVVYTGAGETTSGNHSFAWDGKDANGNALPDGAYKLTVKAKDSASNDVDTTVASAGLVGQIDMSSGTPLLVIGNMEVGVADIAAVAN